MKLKVMLEEGAFAPAKAHKTDAGFDLRTPVIVTVPAHGSAVVRTGIHVQVPEGYAGMVKSKSGLYVNEDITTEGVVDCEYTGSVVVKIMNHGDKEKIFNRGEKITQLVIVRIADMDDVDIVENLGVISEGGRGDSGFGSTGR